MKYNSLEAINITNRYSYAILINITHFDLVFILHNIIRMLPISPTFIHMKGYQDSILGNLDI